VKNFWYLFAAYTIIWTALFAYVLSLSRKNRALQEELQALRGQVEKLLAKKGIS
jgi:CcmD family protein